MFKKLRENVTLNNTIEYLHSMWKKNRLVKPFQNIKILFQPKKPLGFNHIDGEPLSFFFEQDLHEIKNIRWYS